MRSPLAPDRLRRVADALAESGAVWARLAPGAAEDQTIVAEFLRTLANAAPLMGAAPLPAPRRQRRLLPADKRAGQDAARSWLLDLAATWPADQPPPSKRETWRRAKQDNINVPRTVLFAEHAKQWPFA